MKVYSSPIAPPDFADFTVNGRFDIDKMRQLDDAYIAEVIEHVRSWPGFTGEHTGKVVRWARGDGYAEYVVADSAREMCLVHLEVGDAWQLPEAHERGLTRADVVEQIQRQEKLASLFSRKESPDATH